jgi:hypothetical protein
MGLNLELLKQARYNVRAMEKSAFVAAGDPSMGGDPAAAAGGAPPADPSMAGGAPPMDPAMAGGAPPADPSMAGGAPPAGGDPMAAIMPMIQQAVQQAMAMQGGGGSGPQTGGPGIKPKIDVNVEIMQMKKMLAKIVDAMGIHIPAADMVATPEDLNQIAQGGAGYAAATPDDGGGLGAIKPIQAMKAAEEWESGVAFTPPSENSFQQSQNVTRSTANMATALLLRNRVAG